MSERTMVVGFVALVIGIGVLSVIAADRDETDCASRGGTIHCTSGTVVTYGQNGTNVGTVTTCECYSSDGKVIVR